MSDPRPRNEREERLAAERPDSFMRRREFLAAAGALAGGAGLAAAAPTRQAALAGCLATDRAGAFPSPRNIPIDTFVVLMMENRSFDHYLGWFPGADGKNKGLSYPDKQGKKHPTHPLAPDFQGCGFADPDHSWEGGREEYNHGKLDGFYIANDAYAIGYYEKPDLPFLPHIAKAFTLYDRYFASLLGPTYPNRYYMWSAQSGGQITNDIPAAGNNFETIFDRAQAAGLSVGYYASDLPFAALFGKRAVPWIRHVSDFYADAQTGNLPNIAFVDPPFNGEEEGISGDEHPHGDIRYGQTFMSEITHAFLDSPQFRRGAMFINYDEWGGFFDHVSPRFVPDARQSNKLFEELRRHGFPRPRRGGLSLCEARPSQPLDRDPRVDPQADLLPLRPRLPQQAPSLRLADRPHLRLRQTELRGSGPAASAPSGAVPPPGARRRRSPRARSGRARRSTPRSSATTWTASG